MSYFKNQPEISEISGSHAKSMEPTDVSKAVSTSETSANFYQTTRRNIPEDIHFQPQIILKPNSISISWGKTLPKNNII
jgi:hypothetical protein